jgi:hypothetical protein
LNRNAHFFKGLLPVVVDAFCFDQFLLPRFRHGAHQFFRLMELLAEIVSVDGMLTIRTNTVLELHVSLLDFQSGLEVFTDNIAPTLNTPL